MNLFAELNAVDCVGLPRFTSQQAKAVVDRVRSTGALVCDPPACEGRGIVIAGGGRYLSWSWVLVRKLRSMGCNLPIQVWHLGSNEMPGKASELFKQLDCETVDAHQVMMSHPVREIGGWPLKTYAVRHCPWRTVYYLDADCFAEILPEEILNDKDVKKLGSVFLNDVGHHHGPWGFISCSLMTPEKEWETGQFVWDKVSGWMALRWAMWMSEHTDVFYHADNFFGDKGTIHASFLMSHCPYLMAGPSTWEGYGIKHQFKDRHAWSHMMACKRGEWPKPPWMQAAFEEWDSIKLSL